MKKLALILGSSIALTATAFAQTAADVSATDALNTNAEIKMTEEIITVTETADDRVRIDRTVKFDGFTPNKDATVVDGVVSRWSGVIPCASCPGINVTLNFAADGSYELVEQYQGTDGTTFNTQGQATYDAETAVLTLTSTDGETRLMKWENNQLFYIDTVGNALSYYVLQRVQ